PATPERSPQPCGTSLPTSSQGSLPSDAAGVITNSLAVDESDPPVLLSPPVCGPPGFETLLSPPSKDGEACSNLWVPARGTGGQDDPEELMVPSKPSGSQRGQVKPWGDHKSRSNPRVSQRGGGIWDEFEKTSLPPAVCKLGPEELNTPGGKSPGSDPR